MSIKISYGNGIGIKIDGETILLDPKVSDFISFVSHAHFDHTPYEIVTKPYCTEETFELIKTRNIHFDANLVKERKPINFDNFFVELLSSGHMLGSVQVFIETKNYSILYTGDFKTSESLTCKRMEIREADILILESTFGFPGIAFPSLENVRKELINWIEEQLKKGYSINLGGYPIGKSQEIIAILNKNKILPRVSSSIKKYSEIYNKFGVNLRFEENSNVNVKPINIVPSIKNKNYKNCVLSGWTLIKDFGTFGLPLSDHSDFNQILSFVKEINPKKVYCVHGYTKELAYAIERKLKIPAYPLSKIQQKSLLEFKI
ncbi:MAG: MBL fold metallo-hydrolase [Candidatus Aenigmatarchaeota archaeon]